MPTALAIAPNPPPALGQRATSRCTDAAAMPASTGASSDHASGAPRSSGVAAKTGLCGLCVFCVDRVPDLPPDIPPQAGHGGAYIGTPFVAFLLPVTAAAIWWIFASLSRLAPTTARPNHVGVATALFLSAFHVTTLVAFIGGPL